jgi:hypothetical protein
MLGNSLVRAQLVASQEELVRLVGLEEHYYGVLTTGVGNIE